MAARVGRVRSLNILSILWDYSSMCLLWSSFEDRITE